MLVVIGITVLVFGGLFASFEYSLELIAQSRAKMSALSLATDRLSILGRYLTMTWERYWGFQVVTFPKLVLCH